MARSSGEEAAGLGQAFSGRLLGEGDRGCCGIAGGQEGRGPAQVQLDGGEVLGEGVVDVAGQVCPFLGPEPVPFGGQQALLRVLQVVEGTLAVVDDARQRL